MLLRFLYVAAGGGESAAVFGVVPCPGCASAGVSAEVGRTADDALV